MTWERPNFVAGGSGAELDLYVFSDQSLRWQSLLDKLDEDVFGEDWDIHALETSREEDDSWVRDVLGHSGLRDLSPAGAERVRQSRWCSSLHVGVADPPDLRHLRLAWAAAAAALKAGAHAVFDGQSHQWFTACPPHDRFALANEMALVHESDTGLVHTRGCKKFGRPDIAIPCVGNSELDAARDLLEQVARDLASGYRIEPPTFLQFGDGPELGVERFPSPVPGYSGVERDPPVEDAIQLFDLLPTGPRAGITAWAQWREEVQARQPAVTE